MPLTPSLFWRSFEFEIFREPMQATDVSAITKIPFEASNLITQQLYQFGANMRRNSYCNLREKVDERNEKRVLT